MSKRHHSDETPGVLIKLGIVMDSVLKRSSLLVDKNAKNDSARGNLKEDSSSDESPCRKKAKQSADGDTGTSLTIKDNRKSPPAAQAPCESPESTTVSISTPQQSATTAETADINMADLTVKTKIATKSTCSSKDVIDLTNDTKPPPDDNFPESNSVSSSIVFVGETNNRPRSVYENASRLSDASENSVESSIEFLLEIKPLGTVAALEPPAASSSAAIAGGLPDLTNEENDVDSLGRLTNNGTHSIGSVSSSVHEGRQESGNNETLQDKVLPYAESQAGPPVASVRVRARRQRPRLRRPEHVIANRRLARRPTFTANNPDPAPTNKRGQEPDYPSQIRGLVHPDPSVFFPGKAGDKSTSEPVLGQIRKKLLKSIRSLARNPTSRSEEETTEPIEHSAQRYKYDAAQQVIIRPPQAVTRKGPFTLENYKKFCKSAENFFEETMEETEEGPLIRAANRAVEESHEQESAQYGRLLTDATDRSFGILDLKKGDVFVDIGHGIGNSVLQAAYTIGCESRGIELVADRHKVAMYYMRNFRSQVSNLRFSGGRPSQRVGKVSLRRGRLEDPIHRAFLSGYTAEGIGRVAKILANNFNGVFADRCASNKQEHFLDEFIATIFANAIPGSVLLSFHPLLGLPHRFPYITELRMRHKLICNKNASFYEVTTDVLGPANECVSWSANGSNRHGIKVYRYERLQQEEGIQDAKAIKAIPIPAVIEKPFSTPNGTEIRFIMNRCDCGGGTMSVRGRAGATKESSNSD